MSEREQAAREFAEAMGWVAQDVCGGAEVAFVVPATEDRCAHYALAEPGDAFPFRGMPKPDAPLSTHLAFVGRIAEAVGATCVDLRADTSRSPYAVVSFEMPNGKWVESDEVADDLSHAALLAATAALKEPR
jgi:hypothetical protein